MKILKNILLAILGIIVIVLVFALFIDKEFSLSKEIVVNKPKQQVFDYVKLIKNQEHYSVWVMKDPNINIQYTGTDGTVGAQSSWVSNDKNVGVGEQEIIELKEGESMKVELRFKKPFEGTNYAINTFTSVADNQTKVTSTFTGKSPYPMNFMNLFMDMVLGKDMEKNLSNMKVNLEK
ncbi:SRPBCC family protein [Lacibacter sediminis]|uniref:SRPBCC family protein n=1 Tax=Lacibacter sediminis TaxID=2760713 RepID=A0A7G5XKU4_9BACT|nr:SRPBCC family protein [Lacibacter sediminis]QNA46097.1 SRPBCC family protein [Lacibacter sediminis]